MEEFYEQMPLLKSTLIGNGASIFREKTPLGDCQPRLRIESATDDKKTILRQVLNWYFKGPKGVTLPQKRVYKTDFF